MMSKRPSLVRKFSLRSLRSLRRRSSGDSTDWSSACSLRDLRDLGSLAVEFPAEQRFLIDQAKNREWDSFAKGLYKVSVEELNDNFCASTEFQEPSILHFVLPYNPPFYVVSKIAQDLPASLLTEDCRGHMPLHLAVANKSSKYVIGHLAKTNPQACNHRDHSGKTPLHCCFDGPTIDNLSPEVVENLVEASPSSLDIEDDEEMCPLETAILMDAPLKVVLLMQRVKRRRHQKITPQDHSSKFLRESMELLDLEFGTNRLSISSSSA